MTRGITVRFSPFTIVLRRTFAVSAGSRTTTPAMLVEIEVDGITGYGECSMPPYLGETQASAQAYFERLEFGPWNGPGDVDAALTQLHASSAGPAAARAAVDIALHDLVGKLRNTPLYKEWGLDPTAAPRTSFTLGIDRPEAIARQAAEAGEFSAIKLKLGSPDDRALVEAFRSVSDQPLRVDANGGWKDRDEALRMCLWLADRNVELVEQPFARDNLADSAWLRSRSPLPLIADESIRHADDLAAAADCFHGVNIKLMKCGGLRPARAMIAEARARGLRVMLGCMTETSCAISAAAQIASLADWVDLDGALLIANDPFAGATLTDGRILPTPAPGIGVHRLPAA